MDFTEPIFSIWGLIYKSAVFDAIEFAPLSSYDPIPMPLVLFLALGTT